jgi:hypothetical protein
MEGTMVSIREDVKQVRVGIEAILVPIDDIAEGYGKWKPDLRVDPRLRDRLVKAAGLIRADADFGADFKLPVSSCYRPFKPNGYDYDIKDATDPRGHWSGLAIDIGYRNVLPERLHKRFVRQMKKAGLFRIHLAGYGEWWHFSRYGKYIPSGISKWRPAKNAAKLRGRVCRASGIM